MVSDDALYCFSITNMRQTLIENAPCFSEMAHLGECWGNMVKEQQFSPGLHLFMSAHSMLSVILQVLPFVGAGLGTLCLNDLYNTNFFPLLLPS